LFNCVQDKLSQQRPADAQELWLIVVSGHQQSQNMGVKLTQKTFTAVNQELEASHYDKVFIYQYAYDGIWQWERGVGWKNVVPDVFESHRKKRLDEA